MEFYWNDTLEIAIALSETYPEIDPQMVRFTQLYRWVAELPGFKDDIKRCNEKTLEAIQMAWMEEVS